MKSVKDISLRILLPFLALFLGILVALGTFYISLSASLEVARNDKTKSISRQIHNLQGVMNFFISKNNYFEMNRIVSSISSDPDIVYTLVVDEKGSIIVSSDRRFLGEKFDAIAGEEERGLFRKVSIERKGISVLSENEKYIHAIYPLTDKTDSQTLSPDGVNYVVEKYDFSGTKKNILRKEQILSFVSVLLYLGIFFILFLLFYSTIVRKLRILIKTASDYSSGNLKARTQMRSSDAAGIPGKSMDDMMNSIYASQKMLMNTNEELRVTVGFLNEYMKVVDESTIMSKGDLEGNIIYVNDEFCRVTGYSRLELMGMPHSIMRHPDTSSDVYREIWNRIQNQQKWRGVLRNKRKDGSDFYTDMTIIPIIDEEGRTVEYIALRYDVTELVENREKLKNISEKDMLTGFPNRYKLSDDLASVAEPAIGLCNIDNFQQINDFFGYTIGDKIIRHVGGVIAKTISDYGYTVYRLTGDEFAILGRNITDTSSFIKNIELVMQEISKDPSEIDGILIPIQVSAGISFYSDNILIKADIALKRAKKTRKHLVVYDNQVDTNEKYKKNLDLTQNLKKAIADNRIVPFFQPIVNNATGKIEKYECLARMIEENGRVISPSMFLDVARQARYYSAVTKCIFMQSCDTFANLPYEFSINLTLEDLQNLETTDYVKRFLKKNHDIAKRIVFELVESEEIEWHGEVLRFLFDLKLMGSKLAIDDFGTGYSNFEYLLKLDPDYIKIDGSLIKNMDENMDIKAIVETIVTFAKKRNIKTIAEYVHSAEIMKILTGLGVDFSQGYHTGMPSTEIQKIFS